MKNKIHLMLVHTAIALKTFAASILFIGSTFALLSINSTEASAKEFVGGGHRKKSPEINTENARIAAACNPATAKTDMDINNVRTKILSGGDMWWDFTNAQYEIPKGGGVHSLFAGALWIGGIDPGGNLKVAAMNYRQGGSDFWPGPLDTTNASIQSDQCEKYDKHFKITRKEVLDYINGAVPTAAIINWPGNGDQSLGQGKFLAPFYDAGEDGLYDYATGDYPGYDFGLGGTGTFPLQSYPTALPGNSCVGQLFGDQTLWWVFNDKGNIHGETGSPSVGLEVRAQAFAFNTDDDINNMTFYQYQIINRSKFQLNQCYFGQWVDADLGCYTDDYVGCDVGRGLGYAYNGDADDDIACASAGYGLNPPAVGVDFFQGPLADAGDGVDNDRDCLVDEVGEQIIMSRFVYYNNDFSPSGEPQTGSEFYGYLKGTWKDGLPMTYGGNGRNGSVPCQFMFPGTTDRVYSWGTGGNCQIPSTLQPVWTEKSAGNVPFDRRFLQSAGPFTLLPGAVNYITVGVPWARATSGGELASIPLLQAADDKAQALFDNCFKVLNGPDAPDMTIQELDREIILTLSNKVTSNNYQEKYSEKDPLIIDLTDTLGNTITSYDKTYEFQGYQIFQLKEEAVSTTDLKNPDKARLAVQCDVKDGVAQLVNFQFDQTLNANVATLEVTGADKGIAHSFRLTEDLFATGNTRQVNHKTYYYMAIAYGYNNFKTYDPNNPQALDGQKKPYKGGRQNVKVYSAIPHIPAPEAGGTISNSSYGGGPKITLIEGTGNGGMILDLTQASTDAIVASSKIDNPTYENGKGPVNIKVVDPLNVPDGSFTLKFTGVSDTSNWALSNGTTTISSEKTIRLDVANEQLIPEWGISVSITQVNNPGQITTSLPNPDASNGFIEATMSFSDPTKQWLTGLEDEEGFSMANWIRSGTVIDPAGDCLGSYNDILSQDNDGVFERVLDGIWAPYRVCADKYTGTISPLASCYYSGPAWDRNRAVTEMKNLSNVDVYITNDKSKWTRCVVLELAEETTLAVGGARKLDPRKQKSVDKNGNSNSITVASTNPNDPNYISAYGMGWFPGYAINLETGERLNMAFGENSFLTADNGNDMKWNPTSKTFSIPSFTPVFGGQHCIYVYSHTEATAIADKTSDMPNYDAGAKMWSLIDNTISVPTDSKKKAINRAMWVNIPLLVPGRTLIETDVKIRLRVKKAYMRRSTGSIVTNGSLVIGQCYYVERGPVKYGPFGSDIFNSGTVFTATTATGTSWTVQATEPSPIVRTTQNCGAPMYTFNTSDLKTVTEDADAAKNALDLINVVPNPYYAFSGYETGRLDNRVKFTNLPVQCKIQIYTVNGTLVRKFTKDDTKTSLDWDMKNQAGIPVASGLYIIHVDAEGIGEKILKWFGVMRPLDLDSF